MAIKVGISGFGRISRVVIRIAMSEPDIEIAGINIRNADYDYLVYMLKYDSTFGRFPGELGTYENGITINGRKVPVYSESDAANIPWSECGAEYIIEGTGAYTTTEKAMAHIEKGGAKKVIISAPAKDAETPTFVYGVNHMEYKPEYKVVSNASCTTNCLAPLSKVLEDNWGIEEGLMSTIHAATAKQKVVDARSMKDWRTGRSVFNNIIPTTTGAAKAVGLRVAKEVFADRAYEEDGSLVARSKPGAMITDEDEAVARVIKMIKEGTVTAITGKEIPVEANSVCVHGDGPKALAFVQKIRKALEAENIRIASIEEVIGK